MNDHEAIEAAGHLLPWWVSVGPPLLLATASVGLTAAIFLLVRLASGTAARLGPEVHWTERARAAWPGRELHSRALLFCATWCSAAAALFAGPWAAVTGVALALAVGLLVLGTGMVFRWSHERRLRGPWLTLGVGVQSVLSLLLLFWSPVLVSAAMAVAVPARLSPPGLAVFWALLVLFLLAFRGGGLAIARVLGLGRPASARLQAIVDTAAIAAGRPAPEVYEVSWAVANALAFPAIGTLAVSDRMLAVLSNEEIRSVVHHELAHLAEPRSVLLRRYLGAPFWLVLGCWNPIVEAIGYSGFLGSVVVGGLLLLTSRGLVRRMEKTADAAAHSQDGRDPVYGRALEAMYRDSLLPAVLKGRFGSHPSLYDRLEAVGIKPDYPRPEPPKAVFPGTVLAIALLAAVVTTAGVALHFRLAREGGRVEKSVLVGLAVNGGSPEQIADLADCREARGRFDDAALLLRAASALAPWSAGYPAREAVALARAGRRHEAEEALGRAERLAQEHPHLADSWALDLREAHRAVK